ncbi:MAG: ABC-F family ATP-binding cassette domain-containing protein [Vallitaleaceae bacterium]|jgi:ATPase subunit of ABC transporter with duplicated ATPase domains|nr:ABC-F family ATP-binding cassette domain-containing protein [Vallitaleaceae bacterium]
MSILTVENVNHDFGGRKILEEASFRLLKGEHVGLVGANGEGKSTFLNIITGELLPDEGKIEWCKRITTGYLDQHTVLKKGMTIREALQGAFAHMFDMEKEMLEIYEKMAEATPDDLEVMMEDVSEIQLELEHHGFYTIDSKIDTIANGLGLGSIGLEKYVDELSGGQRTKVLLTKLLLEAPMILILDEPTNFLDVEHINWLRNYLINYENAFIIVSHDMEFLNEVTNITYYIEGATLTRFAGNYEFFKEKYELQKRQVEKAFDKQQKEIKKLEVFVAKNKARVATSNMAKSRQKKLDNMDTIELVREKTKPIFGFIETRAPSRYIFDAENLIIGYDEPLTRSLNIRLERGQKVAITGVNGLGKSTLIKTLLGIINPVEGKVTLGDYLVPGYFEQEAIRDNNNTALEEIWQEFPSMTNAGVRGALARCGLTTEHITTKMIALSGGENAKVRLCKLMLRETNWLVLDEPTNHLDIDAKDALKKAVSDFKGTVFIVSHDPSFYEDWITDIWNVEDWTTKVV